MIAHGVELDQVRLIDKGDWQLPHCRDRLADQVERFGADLLVLDPVSSYLADGLSENDGTAVRAVLEALAWIAERTGACVVGVRHPGKASENVMVGSREWNAVPRSVVELVNDQGPPARRILRHYKDSLGQDFPPRCFELVGDQGKAKVFTLADTIEASAAALAKEVPDRHERGKIEQAVAGLRDLLAEGEMEASAVFKWGENEKLAERTMRYAAERLGVIIRREGKGKGHRSLWSLPPASPAEGG